MIVEQIMKTEVYTLTPENTLNDALNMMRDKNIRHIPIVDEEGNIVGLITSHDVKNALPSCVKEEDACSIYETPIEKFMVKDIILGHPLDFVEDVAMTFYESKISCLPIVSGGKLVGIVTTSDLLNAYIELTGAHQPSSKIDIRLKDKVGTLADVLILFKKHYANVLSILVFPDAEHENSRIISIRVRMMNPLPIIKDLRDHGYEVLWPNVPGVNV
ncbi:acetoin utilization AcuB family protein [Ureibacillus sp. FSL K6-8385]|uniref:CBS domain-containing protein n=1 Tax=Ureibacillus terrenus TaxID=118246 RepID=A0A540V0I1_9BACL|nr:acetoin utilization AcuB family protein [Ureibacillus terrenus]MED3662529.1 acetoin utilization AcuB family protein [Ureibacillus terrenus]MED3764823.1 acetoin utilization AcuB family protein [Ureibacillus terrenus]TQE90197.1 CBS domain-containing protein [Ureibacillus terrenus]